MPIISIGAPCERLSAHQRIHPISQRIQVRNLRQLRQPVVGLGHFVRARVDATSQRDKLLAGRPARWTGPGRGKRADPLKAPQGPSEWPPSSWPGWTALELATP